jgi:hypothetical protein
MRGFKTAHGKLGRRIWSAWQRIEQLEKRRAAIPRRVPVQSVLGQPVLKMPKGKLRDPWRKKDGELGQEPRSKRTHQLALLDAEDQEQVSR